MDTVLLFALPLVGGLIFCSHFNFTRWRTAREDGHRLYFRAVLSGAIIFALVAWLRTLVEARFPCVMEIESPIKAVIGPMAKDAADKGAVANLAITCFVSMLLAFPLAWFCNLAFRKKRWLRKTINQREGLEKFLLAAADAVSPIMATMNDGKVYVGYVVEGFDPAEDRKYLQLLPLMSGVRDGTTKKVSFTTFYTDLYGGDPRASETSALPDPLRHLQPTDFVTWLPVECMSSCRRFDARAYLAFQNRVVAIPSADDEASG